MVRTLGLNMNLPSLTYDFNIYLEPYRSSELLDNITSNHPETPEAEQVSALGSELDDDKTDLRLLLLARSYLSVREYRRAAHVLSPSTSLKAIFIRNYALYQVRLGQFFPMGCSAVIKLDQCFIPVFASINLFSIVIRPENLSNRKKKPIWRAIVWSTIQTS